MKTLIPQTLFYRFLLMIVVPITILQILTTIVFYERHWYSVSHYMYRFLVEEIEFLSTHEDSLDQSEYMGISIRKNIGYEYSEIKQDVVLKEVIEMLSKKLNKEVIGTYDEKYLNVKIIVKKETPTEYIFSARKIKNPTTYIFIIWMVCIAGMLIIISLVFMKNQVRSIVKLTEVADSFGKGRDVEYFTPAGALEIKTAGNAFLKMKKKIERDIKYRTELLSHISHDLRTPLTRMKLIFSNNNSELPEINEEIAEMEEMISSYLNFAKGEGNEKAELINVNNLIVDIVLKTNNGDIDINLKNSITNIFIRPIAFKRAIKNILDNSLKFYKKSIQISAYNSEKNFFVVIDDDGPGIIDMDKKMAFKPFKKIQNNKQGYGLGLSIVKSIIQAHGGKISLSDSPMGGLRVSLSFPL